MSRVRPFVLALFVGSFSPFALADDGPVDPASPEAPASPVAPGSLVAPASPVAPGSLVAPAPTRSTRHAALDAAVRRLERPLTRLRRARTEVAANRPEPRGDEATRRRADLELRGLRDLSRYETARAEALDTLEAAEVAKDAAKTADAVAALEALDAKFLEAMKRLEESLDALGKPASTGKADADGASPSSPPAGKDTTKDAATKRGAARRAADDPDDGKPGADDTTDTPSKGTTPSKRGSKGAAAPSAPADGTKDGR